MNINIAKVRDLTFRKGLTQTKVAKASGLARITVNSVYNGRSCSEDTAQKIADVLGVPLQSIQSKGAR